MFYLFSEFSAAFRFFVHLCHVGSLMLSSNIENYILSNFVWITLTGSINNLFNPSTGCTTSFALYIDDFQFIYQHQLPTFIMSPILYIITYHFPASLTWWVTFPTDLIPSYLLKDVCHVVGSLIWIQTFPPILNQSLSSSFLKTWFLNNYKVI